MIDFRDIAFKNKLLKKYNDYFKDKIKPDEYCLIENTDSWLMDNKNQKWISSILVDNASKEKLDKDTKIGGLFAVFCKNLLVYSQNKIANCMMFQRGYKDSPIRISDPLEKDNDCKHLSSYAGHIFELDIDSIDSFKREEVKFCDWLAGNNNHINVDIVFEDMLLKPIKDLLSNWNYNTNKVIICVLPPFAKSIISPKLDSFLNKINTKNIKIIFKSIGDIYPITYGGTVFFIYKNFISDTEYIFYILTAYKNDNGENKCLGSIIINGDQIVEAQNFISTIEKTNNNTNNSLLPDKEIYPIINKDYNWEFINNKLPKVENIKSFLESHSPSCWEDFFILNDAIDCSSFSSNNEVDQKYTNYSVKAIQN